MKTKLINPFLFFKKISSTALLSSAAIFLISFITITSFSNPALALTTTGTLNINATINAACSMTVPSINFGTYSGSQLTQTGTINVTCTNGAAYWISLNAGLGTGATVTTRIMNAGSATLHYSLYRDSGYSLVWGITQGTNTVSGTGTGSQQNITVYAMMPASQPLTVGSYSDTVTATINY